MAGVRVHDSVLSLVAFVAPKQWSSVHEPSCIQPATACPSRKLCGGVRYAAESRSYRTKTAICDAVTEVGASAGRVHWPTGEQLATAALFICLPAQHLRRGRLGNELAIGHTRRLALARALVAVSLNKLLLNVASAVLIVLGNRLKLADDRLLERWPDRRRYIDHIRIGVVRL